MLTLQLGHARISKPEVLSKFKGGGMVMNPKHSVIIPDNTFS